MNEDFNELEINGPDSPFSDTRDVVVVSEILPPNITIIPIQPRPIFPNVLTPLIFSGERFLESLKHAYEHENRLLGLALVKEENKENYFSSDLYEVGTVIKIYRVTAMPDDSIQIMAQGLQRFERLEIVQQEPHLKWAVQYHNDPPKKTTEEHKAYFMAIMSAVKELIQVNPIIQESLKMMLTQMTFDDSFVIMDIVSSILTSAPDKLQDLLETFDINKRAEKLLILLKEEQELFSLQDKISKQIDEKVSKQQKEFFLREQLKAIKQELGLEKDGKSTEIEKFENRIKNLTLTEEASKVVQDELTKLKMMEPQSSEYNVTRNYLDVLTELPWGIFSKDNNNIKRARRILNRHHYGLDDVKQRILEFISTMIKRGKLSGSIICLVGPPGVGKTSIGRSIAEALNREFFRFSVGGMRDEAEIKGHRRTYIGAMPGKIIQSLKRTQTTNPVLMMDEIDKIGKSFQGDPASALLEVLDPEQNKDFLDHYLDVRFDLSNILFITTANQLDTIPRPLLDRMELIRLSGYILEEKLEIAKKYLIPRQLEEHGLDKSEFKITNGALRFIIDGYAREAGVRNLENQLKKIMRQATLQHVEENIETCKVNRKNIEKYLGKPVFNPEELFGEDIPGVVNGLAWTAMGGATLQIESSAIKSKSGGFKLTGQLGEVMQESAQIAYSVLRSMLSEVEGYKSYFDKHFIHLHVPAGATPKDGPSAGITMALSLYSLITGEAISQKLAMTGELTLTGRVLPIGGVKEKTIAARRLNIPELIFPKANKKDFEELPEYIKEGLNVHFVGEFDEVLAIAYQS